MPTILIIDDNEDLRETLVAVLEEEGYALLVAEDGVSGVQAYAEHRPDLVITDLVMPKVDGFDTIRKIRAIVPQARILAMSGGSLVSREDYLTSAISLGAMFVLQKPFEIDDLTSAVSECLGNSHMPGALPPEVA